MNRMAVIPRVSKMPPMKLPASNLEPVRGLAVVLAEAAEVFAGFVVLVGCTTVVLLGVCGVVPLAVVLGDCVEAIEGGVTSQSIFSHCDALSCVLFPHAVTLTQSIHKQPV